MPNLFLNLTAARGDERDAVLSRYGHGVGVDCTETPRYPKACALQRDGMGQDTKIVYTERETI